MTWLRLKSYAFFWIFHTVSGLRGQNNVWLIWIILLGAHATTVVACFKRWPRSQIFWMFNRGRNQQEDEMGEIKLTIFRVQVESLWTVERLLNDLRIRHVYLNKFHLSRCKTDTMVSTIYLATRILFLFVAGCRRQKHTRFLSPHSSVEPNKLVLICRPELKLTVWRCFTHFSTWNCIIVPVNVAICATRYPKILTFPENPDIREWKDGQAWSVFTNL